MDPKSETPPLVEGPADIVDFTHAIEEKAVYSWMLTSLLSLGVLAALFFARPVVMPIVMAFMLSMVFAPVVRMLARLKVPHGLGAGVVVLGLVAALGSGGFYLAEPAAQWLEKSPKTLRGLSAKLSQLSEPVQRVNQASAQVEKMSTALSNGGTSGSSRPREVVVQSPSFAASLLDTVPRFAVGLVSVLVLLYYFLASGNLFLRKVVAVTPRLTDRKRAVEISRQMESEVSGYLFMVAVINTGLGCAVALAMWALGVPNPALWGVMAGLFNFIPYLGDIASFLVLAIVGLLSFDELWRAALVPGSFYLLTAMEGYLITPHLLSKRLSLNPVVIVVSVLFWGWMWGVFGALLAVPMLVALKTLCDRVKSLQAFGEFLGV